ncbi:MAG: tRNA (cytidine(56)-2'-O)-methyltransferase [Candidatus Anstonellaceae archaeon]
MVVCVLRMGHRLPRDQRITTHVFLAARAFGADEGVLCGEEDAQVIATIRRVCEVWGGNFPIIYEEKWKKFLLERKKDGWKIVHLTMYGEDFEKAAKQLSGKNIVVVVGAGKVPSEVYGIADYNLAVLNQPHSEISALALFLDRYYRGRGTKKEFDGKLKIIPNKCGKSVVRVKNR